MKETEEMIVVFGYSNQRFDIPKSHIIAVGRNVILDINFPGIFRYEVDRDAPIPSGKPATSNLIDDEAIPSPIKPVDEALYTQLITKEVLTNDRKHLGHVDGFDNVNIIVKNGLFNPRYYKIPREKVGSFQKGKVLLNISEQDTKGQYKRKYPDYFKDKYG